ncbi:hypothetical protein SAMN05216351_11377 [Pseudobutyrivibrio sp. JW11]|uniref:tetratricopeptide repeat protein n=1 Tax=Pseudobutyrivibrio sp. JW11 TaxID=1855302 RepID=UPI0008EB2E83|nr:hypothetical protein [Pseudobutyrivibrio sp. JW11]SFO52025.1 hypothetical protein SAMN05216351_11377 [Pseudobutyrivibrio sp. JW11]
MEKMEYRTRIEEMKNLIEKNKFTDAMSVADTINWRKVHNINDLIAGSESYEAAGRIEEARDLLLVAHERSPIGRMILYKLCMISLKLKEIDVAQEYYNEFVQIAPHDSLKYILKYNINVAKGADNATLIKILEQLKENDFIEEWAYELAYLYHKTNQGDKCIALCDEIILWFGDGPVVERALELKMLYQPLDKSQEDKYRSLQQKKDGITEITPQIVADSSSIVPNIKNIQLPEGPERFDTINLQAEIKKNIDEIMKATDAGEVSENIGAIKNLVEEIPYLQVADEEVVEEPEDFSINDTFQQYLEEGFDGQMSLKLADESTQTEEQIEGQMTIEDVLAEWEKTKRAAEAAMEDAKSKELESARAKALREANNVLNRLEGVMSKLDAGMSSQELLKEEYLGAAEPTEVKEVQLEEEESVPDDTEQNQQPEYTETHAGFTIPMLSTDGLQTGMIDIPVVSAEEAALAGAAAAVPSAIMHAAGELKEATPSWQPPTLNENDTEETEDVDFKEASQMIADVNSLLQKEIDRLSGVDTQIPVPVESYEEEPVVRFAEEPAIVMPDMEPVAEIIEGLGDEFIQEPVEEPEQAEQVEAPIEEVVEESEEEPIEESIEESVEEPSINIDDIELPPIILPEDLFAEEQEPAVAEPQFEEVDQIQPEVIQPELIQPEPVQIEKVQIQEAEIPVAEVNPPVAAPNQQSSIKVDDEDLDIFSYFLPINGMKANITRVIEGAASYLDKPNANGGSIVIVGEPGSGKTQMATSIIKVLQKKTGYPKGGIGKISGEKLNEKDIQKLYSKIQGGCLIIESAGGISKETAVTLSLLMQNDTSGTIIIIEDSKKGIDKALIKDSSFAKRFTEKIVIPVFSIDELVSFAKTYALEAECTIDDMGILALYNRINLIGRYDHVTTIKEVAEIMDDAIEKSTKGGFFNKPKYDKNGNIILKEKDFDK